MFFSLSYYETSFVPQNYSTKNIIYNFVITRKSVGKVDRLRFPRRITIVRGRYAPAASQEQMFCSNLWRAPAVCLPLV